MYKRQYQNCVQGYNPAVDGTIVVTRGDRIVASNDTALLDTTVDENPTPVSYTHLARPLQRGARRKYDRGHPDPAHHHGGGHHGQDLPLIHI